MSGTDPGARFWLVVPVFSEPAAQAYHPPGEYTLTDLLADRNYDEAIKVMQRASAIPNKWKTISFHDEVRAGRTLPPCPCTVLLSA